MAKAGMGPWNEDAIKHGLGIQGVMNQEAASGEGNSELKRNSKQSSNPGPGVSRKTGSLKWIVSLNLK